MNVKGSEFHQKDQHKGSDCWCCAELIFFFFFLTTIVSAIDKEKTGKDPSGSVAVVQERWSG